MPKFGEKLTNPHASVDNPTRTGIFVETITRTGRLNPGKWARLTDGNGKV